MGREEGGAKNGMLICLRPKGRQKGGVKKLLSFFPLPVFVVVVSFECAHYLQTVLTSADCRLGSSRLGSARVICHHHFPPNKPDGPLEGTKSPNSAGAIKLKRRRMRKTRGKRTTKHGWQ